MASVAILVAGSEALIDPAAGASIAERFLTGLERSHLPPDELLAVRLAMVTAPQMTDAARRLIEETLASTEKIPGDVLLGCASLSRARGFALAQQCYDKYQALYGMTPALAEQLAEVRASSNGAKAAVEWLAQQRQSSDNAEDLGWDLALARTKEHHDTPRAALEGWKQVFSDTTPPLVLREILEARSPWSDGVFARALVDSLQAATGERCLWWRYYDARWLLREQANDSAATARAVDRLNEILSEAPEVVRATLLLADAYQGQGRPARSTGEPEPSASPFGSIGGT